MTEVLTTHEHDWLVRPFKKIVLTGGPCAGKSAAQEVIQAHYGERVVLVPEAATLLFSNGFPLAGRDLAYSEHWNRATQEAVFNLQRSLEAGAELLARERGLGLIICDRGNFDNDAYSPGVTHELCAAYGIDPEERIRDYDGVIHLETIAVDPELPYGSDTNATRLETREEAAALCAATKAAWQAVKNEVHVIPTFPSFEERASHILAAIERITDLAHAS